MAELGLRWHRTLIWPLQAGSPWLPALLLVVFGGLSAVPAQAAARTDAVRVVPLGEACAAKPSLMEIAVNGSRVEEPFVVLRRDCGGVMVRQIDLHRLRLCVADERPTVDVNGHAFVLVNSLPGVRMKIDEASQRLLLSADAEAFCPAVVDLGAGTRTYTGAAEGIGTFLNYALSGSNAGGNTEGGAYVELGAFSDYGVLQTKHSFYDGEQRRLATFYQYDDEGHAQSFFAGDVSSAASPWSSFSMLGGLRWARNFATRPDLVVMPVIDFDYSADSATRYRLRSLPFGETETDRGYSPFFDRSAMLPPGPVRIVQRPQFDNSLQVLDIFDRNGTRQTFTQQSFYTGAQLRQGLQDWELALGAPRDGLEDRYNGFAVSGLYRYGFSRWLTAGAGAGASTDVQSGGLIAQVTVPWIGALDAHVAYSREADGDATGHSWSTSLVNVMQRFGYSLRYQQATAAFDDDLRAGIGNVPRRLASAMIHWSLGQGWATYGAWQWLDRHDGSTQDLWRAGLNYTHATGARLNLILSQQLHPQHETGVGLVLELPFSALSAQRWAGQGRAAIEADWSPDSETRVDGRVSDSYDIGYGRLQALARHRFSGGDYDSLGLSLEMPRALAFAETTRVGDQTLSSAGLIGGLVHYGGVTQATRLGSGGVALVDLGKDFPGVRVNGVATDEEGRVLLVNLQPWQRNELHIDNSDLPYNAQLPDSELYAVPRGGAGVIVRPGVQLLRDALVTITIEDADGKTLPLPPDSLVHDASRPQAAAFPIGSDGRVYVQAPTEIVRLQISWASGSCERVITLPGAIDRTPELAPLHCP